jgi:ankyrin repeat protein
MLIEYLHFQVLMQSICEAAAEGDIHKVELILQDNPRLVKGKDDSGSTPLHIAVRNGHRNLAELFIHRGTKINARDSKGQTALHLAVAGNHIDIVELLIEEGAHLNIKDLIRQTPLKIALSARNREILDLLTECGAKE